VCARDRSIRCASPGPRRSARSREPPSARCQDAHRKTS
jgi:hypothetical protein